MGAGNIFYQKKTAFFFFFKFNLAFSEEVRGKDDKEKTSMDIVVMQSCEKDCSLDNYKYSEIKSLLSRTLC